LKVCICDHSFNFTAIAANLPASAAMMGNVVIWKPSDSQVFSAQIIIEVFKAGVPDGVIKFFWRCINGY
jgi:1-pyrroline-5-carboxylate dehydrogenase